MKFENFFDYPDGCRLDTPVMLLGRPGVLQGSEGDCFIII
jgi:hypothetical protein